MKDALELLLGDLKSIHPNTDIAKKCEKLGVKWSYELIISALEINQPLIIGFNWGVNTTWPDYISGKAYQPQTKIVSRDFIPIYKGSISRVVKKAKKYYPDNFFSAASHTNLCFFRSIQESDISQKDIDVCLPIFDQLINILQPSIVFCVSAKARDYLIEKKAVYNLETYKIVDSRNGRKHTFNAAKGQISNGVPILFLPHPNAKMLAPIRDKAWDFCCLGIKKTPEIG